MRLLRRAFLYLYLNIFSMSGRRNVKLLCVKFYNIFGNFINLCKFECIIVYLNIRNLCVNFISFNITNGNIYLNIWILFNFRFRVILNYIL